MSRIFLCFFIAIGFFSIEIFGDQSDESVKSSSFEKKIAEIDETILREMQQIQDLQGAYGLTDEVLWLYNQLGISYFFRGEYLLALDRFDYIFQQRWHDEENLLIGAAVWGKAMCHACLDMSDELVEDFRVLESYFSSLFRHNCRSVRDRKRFAFSDEETHYSNWIMKTKQVEFTNPNENISAAQCRERVMGSARVLKDFITPLIRDAKKQFLFIQFINGMEDQGIYCCRDGSIWVTCVRPLLQKLENWKILGIPADPAWD